MAAADSPSNNSTSTMDHTGLAAAMAAAAASTTTTTTDKTTDDLVNSQL
jgi:hypothetical protein